MEKYSRGGNNAKEFFENLPVQLSNTTGESIVYLYDATGRKLRKTVGTDVSDYVSGIEYHNNELSSILTEEGRIRPKHADALNHDNYVYDYFLLDHLSNVRVVLTTEERKQDYAATMEMQNASSEEQVFYNILSTRDDKLAGYPADSTYTPDLKASELNAAMNRPIGHAKVLMVTGGDVVHLNTKYFFNDPTPDPYNQRPIIDVLNQLASIFILNPSNGQSIAGGDIATRQEWANQTFINNAALNNFLTVALNESELDNPGKPKAFLVWVCMTKDFIFVPESSGLLQAVDENTLGDLAVLDIAIPDNGYLYIYVTNESSKYVDFDNLQIRHHTGAVLEEEHYYPYGMLIQNLSYMAIDPENNYKYNCIPQENALGLHTYTADFRMLDPTIGRWNGVDPANQYMNPYTDMGGNPVSNIDPTGSVSGAGWSNHVYMQTERTSGDVRHYGLDDYIFLPSTSGSQATQLENMRALESSGGFSTTNEKIAWELTHFDADRIHVDGVYRMMDLGSSYSSQLIGYDVYINDNKHSYNFNDFCNSYIDQGQEAQSGGGDGSNWLSNLRTAAGLTVDWALGVGSDNYTFLNSPTANAMRNSPGVVQARNDYYKTGKTSGGYNFGLKGLMNAGIDPIEQFVGSYNYNISVVGNNLQFTLINTTSFSSAVYHLWPSSWNWNSGPMGNTTQTYIFTEPLLQIKK